MSDRLYHYTTAAGFIGITHGQAVRATNFSFLNDASEVEYGLNLVSTAIESLRSMPGGYSGTFDLDELLSTLQGFRSINDLYVACFTSLSDDLGQWRGYGGSDSDRFRLGIRKDSLSALQAPRPVYASVKLVKLVYDEQAQRDLIMATIQASAMRMAHEMVLALSHLTLRFKNPAFFAENEWRIAVSTLGSACEVAEFAIAGGRLKPFIELTNREGHRLAIEDVIVLPSRAPEQSLKAAQLVMQRNGYSPDIVHLSQIPFVG
jgi:hypothetical protein